jgi:50S ribosomal protein L16 3-hydroxylase
MPHVPPDTPLPVLGGLTPRQFLRDYWQKKPLFVRGAVPEAANVVTPEVLRALAQRPEATSRLVLEEGGEYPWELRHGPFRARDLRGLPAQKWSLLVQEVDRFVPAARALLDTFAFIPRWRIDDLMVSHAAPKGGVGAHVDNYDVFLIQGLGQRRWRIGDRPIPASEEVLVEDLDVAMLAAWDAAAEFVVEPGDLLYLPPRIAHEGVALDACLTLSVGFRAPAHRDLLGGFLEHALLAAPDDAFYTDPDLAPADHPGEIAPEALARLHRVLLDAVQDEDAFRQWVGAHLTEARRAAEGFEDDGFEDEDEPMAGEASEALTPEAVAARLKRGDALAHAPGARLAYVRDAGGGVTLFADGQAYTLEPALAPLAPVLADASTIPAASLAPHLSTPDAADLLAALLEDGALVWTADRSG